MPEHENHGLPRDLERAIATLREPPSLDPAWVRQVADTAMAPHRSRRDGPRGLQLTPLSAVAAAMACMLIGAGATALALRARETPPAAAPAGIAATTMRVRFSIEAPAATAVSIVGDFNGWNPTSLPLQRAGDGRTWVVDVPLAPGRYAYSFMVDGKLARDPAAPQARDDDFGSSNSIVMVRGS